MDSQMGCDVVSLGKGRHGALVPAAGQAEVVLRLAPDVGITKVFVQKLGVVKIL